MTKRDTMYISSNDALLKLAVLFLTYGISIAVSFLEAEACYAAILVQAINNLYDFHGFVDNKRYQNPIRLEAIIVVFTSIIAFILSIMGLIEAYDFMGIIFVKFFTILLVAVSGFVVYSDYRHNIHSKNSH